jgi:hypothetical protein
MDLLLIIIGIWFTSEANRKEEREKEKKSNAQ